MGPEVCLLDGRACSDILGTENNLELFQSRAEAGQLQGITLLLKSDRKQTICMSGCADSGISSISSKRIKQEGKDGSMRKFPNIKLPISRQKVKTCVSECV